jgi:hypothetical protein
MLRLVLIGIPAFLAALLPGLLVTGAVAGALWLFVYGDDTWPALAEIIVVGTFVSSWVLVGSLLTRYLYRRRWIQQLTLPQLVLLATVLSVLAVGVVLLRYGATPAR